MDIGKATSVMPELETNKLLGRWLLIEAWVDLSLHVVPNEDLEPHFLFEDCHCHPKRDPAPGAVELFIHNSFDRRELSEPDYKEPKRLCN